MFINLWKKSVQINIFLHFAVDKLLKAKPVYPWLFHIVIVYRYEL